MAKNFGPVPALSDLNLFVPRGPDHRAARPQRRRQDDRHPGRSPAPSSPTTARCARSASTRRATARTSAAGAAWCRPSPRSTTGCRAGTTWGTRPSSTAWAATPATRIRAAAGRFGIVDALDQQVGGYSTGMKTRLALARSVLHDPELLLFDEPTSGLDPESSHAVLDLIREMTGEGRTVVMCTHLLIEAEGLADQIIVLEAGTDLLARHAGRADPSLLARPARVVRRRGPGRPRRNGRSARGAGRAPP